MRSFPPDQTVPVCGHPKAREDLRFSKTDHDEEVDDQLQVDIDNGDTSRGRQSPSGHLRQESVVVRPGLEHQTVPDFEATRYSG